MRRLKASKGAKGNTLTMFAEKYLVKKAYFELSNETMKFAVPEPGPVSGRDPHVCLAVIGTNGADKYTAVNVLVGMQLPTSGSIRKTAGPRLAYVAQHAFPTLSCTCKRR